MVCLGSGGGGEEERSLMNEEMRGGTEGGQGSISRVRATVPGKGQDKGQDVHAIFPVDLLQSLLGKRFADWPPPSERAVFQHSLL